MTTPPVRSDLSSGYSPNSISPQPPAGIRKLPKDDLLSDALCSLLMVCGVLLALRQVFWFEDPFTSILFRASICIGFWMLYSYRKKIVFLSVVSLIAVYLLLNFINGSLEARFEYWRGLIAWWVILFPRSSPYNTESNVFLIQLIITFVVSTVIMALVRKVRLIGLIGILAAILFWLIIISGFRYNLLPIALISAGCFPLYVRRQHRDLSRKLHQVLISRRRLMLAGILVCCAMSVLALLLVPRDTSAWKKNFGFSLFNNVAEPPFNIKTAGLQPNANQLGGDINLPRHLVLYADMSNPDLLKGISYDTYTGKGWDVKSDNKAYPLDTHLEKEIAESVFGVDLILAQPKFKELWQTDTAKITLVNGGTTLYYSGRLINAYTSSSYPIFFNKRSELFTKRVLQNRSSYTFYSYRLSNITTLDKYFTRPEMQEEVALHTAINEYLQLPKNLPAVVSQTALDVTADASTSYEKAKALETYFRENFHYTLTPGDVPRDKDFVEHFLNTKQGYCVYFASSMAVMARTLGIPSRFVVGYALEYASTDAHYAAYTDTAHAWVECYFPTVGWITFDPTANSYRVRDTYQGMNLQHEPTGPVNSSTTTTNTSSVTTTTSTTRTNTTVASTTSTPTSTTTKQQGKPIPYDRWLLGFGIAAAVMGILYLAYRLLRGFRIRSSYALEHVTARLHTTGEQLDFYYTDILRQLSLLKLQALPWETIHQHAQRIASSLTEQSELTGELKHAFTAVQRWRYGKQSPTEEDIRRIAVLHASTEQMLRSKINPFRYGFLRILLAK